MEFLFHKTLRLEKNVSWALYYIWLPVEPRGLIWVWTWKRRHHIGAVQRPLRWSRFQVSFNSSQIYISYPDILGWSRTKTDSSRGVVSEVVMRRFRQAVAFLLLFAPVLLLGQRGASG